MNYKYFKVNCIIRIILLAFSIGLFLHLLLKTELYASTFIVGFLLILQVVMLIKYIERTNRDLVRFLGSIKYGDFSATFSGGGKSSFGELNEAFNDVVTEFRKARAEKEQRAAENRSRFGRPKAERRQAAAESERERRRHEGHVREGPSSDSSRDES